MAKHKCPTCKKRVRARAERKERKRRLRALERAAEQAAAALGCELKPNVVKAS